MLLLNAVKDVTTSLAQLIDATKKASGIKKCPGAPDDDAAGGSDNDPEADQRLVTAIKDSAKVAMELLWSFHAVEMEFL